MELEIKWFFEYMYNKQPRKGNNTHILIKYLSVANIFKTSFLFLMSKSS